MYSTDRLIIDTPEQITLEFALAGVGSRFLALAIDTLLQGLLYVLVVLVVVLVPGMGKLFAWIPQAWASAIGLLFLFCIYWGYFAAFEVLWRGQTPGKRVMGIRVINDSGRPISSIQGIGRNLMRIVDGFLFYIVGFVCMMISKQNRRLGDYVAGTLVVRDSKTAEIKPDWTADSAAVISTPTAEVQQLSEQDLVVIETYLHRRFDLDPMVRMNTAIRVSQLVESKTGLHRAADQSDDDFLESVARQMREQARFRAPESNRQNLPDQV